MSGFTAVLDYRIPKPAFHDKFGVTAETWFFAWDPYNGDLLIDKHIEAARQAGATNCVLILPDLAENNKAASFVYHGKERSGNFNIGILISQPFQKNIPPVERIAYGDTKTLAGMQDIPDIDGRRTFKPTDNFLFFDSGTMFNGEALVTTLEAQPSSFWEGSILKTENGMQTFGFAIPNGRAITDTPTTINIAGLKANTIKVPRDWEEWLGGFPANIEGIQTENIKM